MPLYSDILYENSNGLCLIYRQNKNISTSAGHFRKKKKPVQNKIYNSNNSLENPEEQTCWTHKHLEVSVD